MWNARGNLSNKYLQAVRVVARWFCVPSQISDFAYASAKKLPFNRAQTSLLKATSRNEPQRDGSAVSGLKESPQPAAGNNGSVGPWDS